MLFKPDMGKVREGNAETFKRVVSDNDLKLRPPPQALEQHLYSSGNLFAPK